MLLHFMMSFVVEVLKMLDLESAQNLVSGKCESFDL